MESSNSGALAEGIVRLMSTESFAHLGKAAFNRYSTRYAMHRMITAYGELYADLLNARAPSHE